MLAYGKSPEELMKKFTFYQLDVLSSEKVSHERGDLRSLAIAFRVAQHADTKGWKSFLEE
jgi:hypothetical protein